MVSKPKIVAVSASLRNARWGKGISNLLERIRGIATRDELMVFIGEEAYLHYQQFIDAGRKDGARFDEIYKNLRKLGGQKGLCNSEVGMVVALWAAHATGCDIDYVPLSSYFDSVGRAKESEKLKEKIRSADGLLLCTPVYFGDRSSLASDFIESIRRDPETRKSLRGKAVAGVAVGAKRNGGQETTLIYQLQEMINLGMVGLGNDTETTAQYGGTLVAGDVGTAAKDEYGLNTVYGAGRRLARILLQHQMGDKGRLRSKLKVMFWVLQDSAEYGLKRVNELIDLAGDAIDATVFQMNVSDIDRCMACDICPTKVGPDSEYRCLVKKNSDPFSDFHEKMIDHDMLVPVVVSLAERSKMKTVYQRAIERTRYLRRGDYLFSNIAIAPLVFEEVGHTENMHFRILTSLIRHHTVMLRPMVGYIYANKLLNWEDIVQMWQGHLKYTKRLTIGRLEAVLQSLDTICYKPVGYVLSASKNQEMSVEKRQEFIRGDRMKRRQAEARERIGEVGNES